MIIKCESCNAKFRLNEEKIKGKGARVRCKKCGEYIIVMKPGYEHLKSLFIDGIKEKEASKKTETERAEEHPPAEKSPVETPPEEEEKPEHEPAPQDRELEVGGEPDFSITESLDMGGEPAQDDAKPETQETAVPERTIDESMVPAEADIKTDSVEEEEKDDIDKAFEQYLESFKLETEEPGAEEVPPAEEKAQAEEGVILSNTETLEFLSETEKKEEATKPSEGEGEFDLNLEEEKLDLSGALDFSSVIQEKPELSEGKEEPVPPEEPVLTEPEAPSFVASPTDEILEAAKTTTEEEPARKETREAGRAEPSPYEVVPRKIIQKKKKKALAGKLLLLLLVLMLLIASGGAYLAFTERGNQILLEYAPQIRAVLGMKEALKGPKFKITNLIGYYEENKKAGKIFVIKGEIINLTKTAKSGLLVKGELLDKKGELIAEKTVYAGNPLTTEKLRTASKTEIDEALNNKLGKNLSNIDVQPGSSVPFMIVFFDLKGEVEAYRVECTD